MCSSANRIELLAPARNFACGKAAVDSGADAVYVAGPAFGAREAAANDMNEVERLAHYGRQYGVKTYLTLNTLLYKQEYEAARRLANKAWEAGCSALIIHDPVLLDLDLPPIPLIASTQMDNRSVEQVRRLQRLGFERVILARELSLPQIAEIRAHTTIAL
ncbi:MAG: U32 family peptidase, partial [Bacteroidales bacterium]|nr:U32 family peptidase [Bacteroidales bacterium]